MLASALSAYLSRPMQLGGAPMQLSGAADAMKPFLSAPYTIPPDIKKLPLWMDAASSGLISSDRPPIFTLRDLIAVPGSPAGQVCHDTDAGQQCYDSPAVPGFWTLDLYGVPAANVPYYAPNPNILYQFQLDPSSGPPSSFFFGIKTARDQGVIYGYQFDRANGIYVATTTSGVVGGRNSIFDTNATIRQGNAMIGIILATVATVGLASYLAAPAAATEAAGAGAAVQTAAPASAYIGTGSTVAAGGGTIAAQTAYALETQALFSGAAAGAAAGAAVSAPEYIGPGSSAATGGGDIAAQTAYAAQTEALFSAAPAVTSSALDAIAKAATDQGGKLALKAAAGAVVSQLKPGQTPAQSLNVAPGNYVLPDGSTVTVNPDGSITIHGKTGGAATVDANGQATTQWVAGVPNAALMVGAVLVAFAALK